AGEKPIIALRFRGLRGHVVTAYDIQDISTDPIEYVIQVYDPNVQFTAAENSASGDEHKTALTGSQIHVAPDGTWGLQNSGASRPSNGLIVSRASTIPDPPTLPGSLAAQLSQAGGLPIFGTAGPPASRTTQLADNASHSLFAADGTLN